MHCNQSKVSDVPVVQQKTGKKTPQNAQLIAFLLLTNVHGKKLTNEVGHFFQISVNIQSAKTGA